MLEEPETWSVITVNYLITLMLSNNLQYYQTSFQVVHALIFKLNQKISVVVGLDHLLDYINSFVHPIVDTHLSAPFI